MIVVRVLAFLSGLALFTIVLLLIAAAVVASPVFVAVERMTTRLRWPAAMHGGVTC